MSNKHPLPEREEVAAILADKTRSKLYPEISKELKAEAISSDVNRKTAALMENMDKVDLNDLQAVKERTEVYLQGCADSGTFPTVMGLASLAFGVSRQWLNEFLRTHPNTPTADFIERTKDLFADILSNAALSRTAAETMSIFILKNCAGFVDKMEITPRPPEGPLGPEPDQIALEAKIEGLVVDE